MVLESQRERAGPLVERVARRFAGYHPNTLTWISLAFAVGAMLLLLAARRWGPVILVQPPPPEPLWMLMFVAAAFIFLNGAFDVLDGAVARLRNSASRRGDLLDHVVDRYADVILLIGFIFSFYGDLVFGLFAMTGVLLTSYMGTQAQALGLKRKYSGWLSRADRIFIMTIVATIQPVLLWLMHGAPIIPVGWLGLSWFPAVHLFGLMLLAFAVIGNLTAAHRALAIWGELRPQVSQEAIVSKELSMGQDAMGDMISELRGSEQILEARIGELERIVGAGAPDATELGRLNDSLRLMRRTRDRLEEQRWKRAARLDGGEGLAELPGGAPAGSRAEVAPPKNIAPPREATRGE